MNKTTTYKVFVVLLAAIVVSLNACSPVKYVPGNKYLLNKCEIKIDSRKVSKDDILNHVRQKPNMKIFGLFRFHLGLYNISGKDVSKGVNRWLRSIGEEPVIYDPFLAKRSTTQLKSYLNSIGYYDAVVADTVVNNGRKRLKQIYNIKLGSPYLVDKLSYFDFDSNKDPHAEIVENLIKQDSVNSLIKKNKNINVEVMGEERTRIARMLKNKGYFNFSDRYIQYYADSSYNHKRVSLYTSLHKDLKKKSDVFEKYKIRNITIKLESYSKDRVAASTLYNDTLLYKDKIVLSNGKPYLRPKVLNSAIVFNKYENYSIDKVEKTYSNLQALRQFKFINIKFKEVDLIALDTSMFVDCTIELRPLVKQSYSIAVEGTNSSGNIGVGGKASYNHRNLLGGAEDFSLSFLGALEKEKVSDTESYNNVEYGVEAKLVSPQFLLPFVARTGFRKKYAPRTAVSVGFNYQNTYYFQRKIVNSSFGYTWRKSKLLNYNFNLLNVDYIEMKNVNQSFLDGLKNDFIKNSYRSHMVVSSSFGFVYSDKQDRAGSNYFRVFIESAGNLANVIAELGGLETITENVDGEKDKYKEFWGIRYAQYLKTDLEYIFKYKFSDVSSIASRFFIGAAYPYGNMKILPYEKMYFGGGANGIRAWQVRTLGPGSFVKDDIFANTVSDMKIEANVEYRFKLIGGLEGAMFVDAGNIWSINTLEDREGADFKIDRFYKEIAVGTGVGLRYDFNFSIIRCDLGIKVIDPAQPEGSRYVFMKNGYNKFNDFTLNIGIAYPF